MNWVFGIFCYSFAIWGIFNSLPMWVVIILFASGAFAAFR